MTRYRTSDLYYAAYLKVAGVPYVGIEWEELGNGKKKGHFLFEDQGSLAMRDLKTQYFRDTAKVPALSYGQALRELKGALFGNRRR